MKFDEGTNTCNPLSHRLILYSMMSVTNHEPVYFVACIDEVYIGLIYQKWRFLAFLDSGSFDDNFVFKRSIFLWFCVSQNIFVKKKTH